jgi:hypothetical protein
MKKIFFIFLIFSSCTKCVHKSSNKPPKNFDNELCINLKKNHFPNIYLSRKDESNKLFSYPKIKKIFSYTIPGVVYGYNPSIVSIPGGYLFSIRFDCTEITNSIFQHYTILSELDKNLNTRGVIQKMRFPSAKDPSLESHNVQDLRLFEWNDAIYVFGNDNFDGYTQEFNGRRQHLYKF